MLLSARILKDVCDVNSFEADTQASWTEGDQLTLYIQLIDASLDLATQGFNPSGRRYIPASGSTLQIVLEDLDDAKKLTRLAAQPFANDGSIWTVSILSTDKIRGSPQMRLTLTEPGKTTRGILKNAIKIYSTSNL